MSLAEFAEPEVFVDANIFVYALAKKHRYKSTCETLLSSGEVKLKYGDVEVIRFIKEHPNVISECEVAYGALDDIFDSSIVILLSL